MCGGRARGSKEVMKLFSCVCNGRVAILMRCERVGLDSVEVMTGS